MAWYNLGKISIDKGTKTLKGEGTKWTDNKVSINAGHIVLLPGSGSVQLYEVGKVISDTEMEIKTEYTGENLTGSTYSIITTIPSSVPDFARRLANQLKYYDDYLTFFGEWVDTDKELEFQMPDGSIKKFPPLSGFVKKTGDVMSGTLETTTKILTKSANKQHSLGFVSSNSGSANIEKIQDNETYLIRVPQKTGTMLIEGDFGIGGRQTLGDKNLNDVKIPGDYQQDRSADATTGRNYPINVAGYLNVKQTVNGWGNGCIQQYHIYAGVGYFQRTWNGTAWSGWERFMVRGDFGLGYSANSGVNPPQSTTKDANDINYSGFATGAGSDAKNFFSDYAPLISAARFGGADGTGSIFQIQSSSSIREPALAYRIRNSNYWSDWSTVATLGSINFSSNRFLAIRADKDNQASYIETQNIDGSLRWRVGSMGASKTRVSLATPNMSASIEQINSIASKGFYLDQNLMFDINGGYEHRFYGFGSNPGVSHTMMFARDTDKMIGFNFRSEDGYVGTLLRIDGKNRVVKVNEKPVMVQGDYGFAGNGVSEGLNESKLTEKVMAYNPSQIFRSSTDPGKFGTIYSPILYLTTGDTWATFSASYLTGNVTVASSNRNKTNPIKFNNLWGTSNTTVDGNGFIKKASPIIEVMSNGDFSTNEESVGARVERLQEGIYHITGVLGLHSDKSWGGEDGGFEIPVDKNKLPLIWIDYKVQKDGSILLYTYHRVNKDAPTFAQNNIEGKLDGEPIDIPKGRFVSVRVQMPEDSKFNKMLKAEQELMAKVDEESSTEYNNDTWVQDEPLIDNDIKLLEFKG